MRANLISTIQIFLTFHIAYIKTANILVVFPSPAESHFRVYAPFFEQLALRGHEVDVLSHFPRSTPLKRYNDLSIKQSKPKIEFNSKETTSTIWDQLQLTYHVLGNRMCSDAINTTVAKQLKESQKKYDLMITHICLSACLYGYAENFKIPVITVTSSTILPWLPDVLGAPDNPSYIPNFYSPYTDDMTYFQRLHNLYLYFITKIWYNRNSMIQGNEYHKSFFGQKSINLDEIVQKTSLMLIASHFSFHQSRPIPSNFIEVAGIHIKPNQSLNEEFKKHLEINPDLKGVIYFSFGSYFNTESFPGHILQTFLEVFEKLPYKVLWKGDIKKFPKTYNIPKTIEFIPWMPQIPILCHSKVKLFITHGGLSSTSETIYCGKPALTLPIWLDQLSNANLLTTKGVGRSILFNEINKENFKSEIEEILGNPKYAKNAKALSEIFRDRPTSPMDTAIYWTEYVIRHKGAKHLRSKSADLPWYIYYCVDITVIPLLVLILLLYFLRKIMFLLCRIIAEKVKKD